MLHLRHYALIAFAVVLFATASAEAGTVRAKSGAVARVADRAASSFQCLINALEREGYKIKFMGGYRKHGSVRGSLHPAGLALDINQYSRNRTRPRMPRNEISLANDCGLVAGAQWGHADSGHFQLGGWAGRGHGRGRNRVAVQQQELDVLPTPAIN